LRKASEANSWARMPFCLRSLCNAWETTDLPLPGKPVTQTHQPLSKLSYPSSNKQIENIVNLLISLRNEGYCIEKSKRNSAGPSNKTIFTWEKQTSNTESRPLLGLPVFSYYSIATLEMQNPNNHLPLEDVTKPGSIMFISCCFALV